MSQYISSADVHGTSPKPQEPCEAMIGRGNVIRKYPKHSRLHMHAPSNKLAIGRQYWQ
jgi:hypothetical protein